MITSDVAVPRRLAVTLAVALALVVLVGCGSSSSSSTVTTTTTATTTTPAAPAPSKAADDQVAQNAQLRLTDFPSGWEESDKASPTTQAPCQAINGAKAATSAHDKSRQFSKGADNAESAVYV